jgi:hypothetical protein
VNSDISKKLAKKFGWVNNKNGFVLAVAVALLIASILLVADFIIMRPAPNETMSITVLNSQKNASDYPELLVINRNNTFNVWVEVSNQIEKSQNFVVYLKVVNNSVPALFPIEATPWATYSGTLGTGKTWEYNVQISLNETGSYLVSFELWVYDKTTGVYEFQNLFCALPIQVIN